MVSVNIALEIFSVLISLIIVVYLFISEDHKERLNHLFVAMLFFNIAVLSCDLVTWLLKNTDFPLTRPLLHIANFGVYSFGYVIVAVFTDYLVTYIGAKTNVPKIYLRVIMAVCAAAILLVGVSQFNHMYYYFDETNTYRRGSLYWLSQALPIAMMLADSVIILKYRKFMTPRVTFSFLSYQLFPVAAMAIQIFFYGLTLLYIGTTLSFLIIYISIQAENSYRLKQQEMELSDSRVNIMLSQIQPHFLYNALTAISHLCKINPDQAQEAVNEFANYLRGNMDSLTYKRLIPFKKELEHVQNYLSLEKRRFGKRLHVEFDIPVQDFSLPALTLQPVVENAVRYGVTKVGGGGKVAIRTEEAEEFWRVIVTDNGVGFDPAQVKTDGRSHVGIENVRYRLQTMCAGTLEISSMPGTGAIAVISIPKSQEP